MQFDQAILDLADIRRRMASAQVFRGYRAISMAASAALALCAAALQERFVAGAADPLLAFVQWWSAVAAASIGLSSVDLAARWLRDPSGAERVRIRSAVTALAPCLVSGAALTAVIVWQCPEIGWVLPGGWALLFAQGVCASAPLLPRSVWIVGAYYVAAGLAVLAASRGAPYPAGWSMAATFGVGQFLAAIVLYASLERPHAAID